MNNKQGKSKIGLVLIILLLLILIAGGAAGAWWFIQKDRQAKSQVVLYEEYTEGAEIEVTEAVQFGEHLKELAAGLTEYRNDELGIRFGYIEGMEYPEDEVDEDTTYVSTVETATKSTTVQFRVGDIDLSQSTIDCVERQKKALKQELIKAETVEEEYVDGETHETKIRKIVPTEDQVSDIKTSFSLLADQLAVTFTYTENDLKCTRIMTVKDKKAYSLTYKATPEEYKELEEQKVFASFEFINKITDSEVTKAKTFTVNGTEYTLPVKATNIEGLSLDAKYSAQKIAPNHFTIVSLYEAQDPKYSAYVYNARACMNEINNGYITAISTDINRGGDLVIYKGIKLGMTLSQVTELIGSPATTAYGDGNSTLNNIYTIDDMTIELKFRNDDFSKPGNSSKVVSILIRVAK